MAETHVISALVSKRSELAGIIDHYRKKITALSEEVKTIDAAIKIFEPDYQTDLIKTRRHINKNKFFNTGDGGRMVLDVMRESGGSQMSTIDITAAIMQKITVNPDHEKLLQKSISSILSRHLKAGNIRLVKKEKFGLCFWQIIKD